MDVSGGKRQRIALARALLADTCFLVLDEPAAHPDPATAERVIRSLASCAGGCGLLVITHSDGGLDAFDEVLELRDGSVSEARQAVTV